MEDELRGYFESIDLEIMLKHFSMETWERLRVSQKFRREVKTYETTITQNLIYEILKIARLTNHPSLRLLEARDESTNGNDLEIFVQYKDGYILFPAQAKSIYPSGKYEKINHQSGGKYQIRALIEYATRRQGVPVYLFYNYHNEWKDVINWNDLLGFEYDCFGCSLTSANFIEEQYYVGNGRKWKIPHFLNLHPTPAIPLFQILETDKMNELWEESKGDVPELALYSSDEIFDDEKWIDLTPPPSISGFRKEEHFYQGIVQMNQPEFKPKFRLVLAKQEESWGGLFTYG